MINKLKLKKLIAAKEEAERFVHAAKIAIKHLTDEDPWISKPHAAAKRAALDAANALHQINKPGD